MNGSYRKKTNFDNMKSPFVVYEIFCVKVTRFSLIFQKFMYNPVWPGLQVHEWTRRWKIIPTILKKWALFWWISPCLGFQPRIATNCKTIPPPWRILTMITKTFGKILQDMLLVLEHIWGKIHIAPYPHRFAERG